MVVLCDERKLLRVGRARGITLPKHWIETHCTDADRLYLFGDGILIVVPPKYKDVMMKIFGSAVDEMVIDKLFPFLKILKEECEKTEGEGGG